MSWCLRRWLQHHQKLCLAVLILNRDKRNDTASEASNGKTRAVELTDMGIPLHSHNEEFSTRRESNSVNNVIEENQPTLVELSLVGRDFQIPTFLCVTRPCVVRTAISDKQNNSTTSKSNDTQTNDDATSATIMRKSDVFPHSSSLITQWPQRSSQPSPSRPPSLPPSTKRLWECRHNYQTTP